ncbi:MAG: hypothetical protein MK033_01295 [Candidatus Caenarcaniphilales bacterium]|nr:hypothetical protein [Candidatus Caenarcaniphilales bacterium]
MDGINNNLRTGGLSPELKDLLEGRTSTDLIADNTEVEARKDRVQAQREDIETGATATDQSIQNDLAQTPVVVEAAMKVAGLGNINFTNNGFGSGNDDNHDSSEAREIKSQAMALAS